MKKVKGILNIFVELQIKLLFKPSPKDRCDKEIKIENNNLVINKLKSDDELFYHKIVNDINKLNIEMITKVLPEFSFHLIPSKGNVPKLTIEETVLFDYFTYSI